MAGSKSAATIHALRVAPRTEKCAATCCHEQLHPGHIFCGNHWFALPKWLRVAIIDTFADADWPAHQEAIRKAADQIDADFVAARAAGMTHVVSGRVGSVTGRNVVLAGRSL
jgi:hypothetical protein